MGILNELAKAGLVDTSVHRVDGLTLAEAIEKYDITKMIHTKKQKIFIPLHPVTVLIW